MGVTVAGNGTKGESNVQLNHPWGIFIDTKNDDLYVTDSYNHRVQKFTSSSNIGTKVAGGHGYGSDSTQLSYPYD
ncbi:unnamed protein product, partial [Didymodactylos carnosus]